MEGAATAVLGLAALEFHVDDQLVRSVAGSPLSFDWDIRDLADGIYRVKLLARDHAGNFATSEKNIVLEVLPPPAPAITQPQDGIFLLSGPVTVTGTSESFTTVRVTRNGLAVGTRVPGADGAFTVENIALVEGLNELVARSEDFVGQSDLSNRVRVFVDSGPPAAPILSPPRVNLGESITLDWRFAEEGERPVRFRIYRHDGPFSSPATATLIKDAHPDLTYEDRLVSAAQATVISSIPIRIGSSPARA